MKESFIQIQSKVSISLHVLVIVGCSTSWVYVLNLSKEVVRYFDVSLLKGSCRLIKEFNSSSLCMVCGMFKYIEFRVLK